MKIINHLLDVVNSYHMRLANGQVWHISAAQDSEILLKKLATIMRLKACETNGYPNLILIRNKSNKRYLREIPSRPENDAVKKLSEWGWKACDISEFRLWSRPDLTDVICEIASGDEYVDIMMMRTSLYPIYQRAQSSGGLPFHAGLVVRNGKGILLAAPRETGKSTCCRRLPFPWVALCDEEALVVLDDQKRYQAHPFPTWSDYLVRSSNRTWNVEHYVPLRAIFFIEQAEVDEVVSLGQGEAAVLINQSAAQVYHRYWYDLNYEELRTRKKRLFENACELAKAVPAFRLRVSLNGRFWEEMENVLE